MNHHTSESETQQEKTKAPYTQVCNGRTQTKTLGEIHLYETEQTDRIYRKEVVQVKPEETKTPAQ